MRLNKMFLLIVLSVCCAGYSALGQRIVSIYEPMYTFDYAVKFHLATGANEISDSNYWLIENFMAPAGVKLISQPVRYDQSQEQIDYSYDVDSRFLTAEIYYKLDSLGNKINNSGYRDFSYDCQSNESEWRIKKRLLTDEKTLTEYVFNRKTALLTKVIQREKDTFYFHHTDQILSNYQVVNKVKLPLAYFGLAENAKLEYNITVLGEDHYFDANFPFIYIDEQYPPYTSGSSKVLSSTGMDMEKFAKKTASKFNDHVRKNIGYGNKSTKIKLSFEMDSHAGNGKRGDYSLEILFSEKTLAYRIALSTGYGQILHYNYMGFDRRTSNLKKNFDYASVAFRDESYARTVKYIK